MGEEAFGEEGVYGALGSQGMEEEQLQRLGGVGRLGSTPLDLQGAPQAEKLLRGLVSKSLQRGRIDAGQKHGPWGTRELGWPW